jgi:hypothetical protein
MVSSAVSAGESPRIAQSTRKSRPSSETARVKSKRELNPPSAKARDLAICSAARVSDWVVSGDADIGTSYKKWGLSGMGSTKKNAPWEGGVFEIKWTDEGLQLAGLLRLFE